MTIEATESTVFCDVCSQNISFSELQVHINLHASQLRSLRQKHENAKREQKKPQRRKLQPTDVPCSVCGKPFRNKNHRELHEDGHFLYDYTCDYCHTSFKKAKFHSVISHSCVVTPKARIPYRDQLRKRERQKRTIQVHNPESNQANPSSTTETATTTETIHQSSTKGTPSNHNTERETELLKEGQPIEGEAFSHIDIDALDISTQLARPWDNPQPLLWSLVGEQSAIMS